MALKQTTGGRHDVRPPRPASGRTKAIVPAPDRRTVITLFGGLTLTAIAVWQLRLAGAPGIGPWLLLIVGMLVAAAPLRSAVQSSPRLRSDASSPVLPPARRRQIGRVLLACAVILTALIALKLWPDISDWRGTPTFWLIAILCLLIGAWLTGPTSPGPSPSIPRSVLLRNASWNIWWEATAVLAILVLAVFLRTYRTRHHTSGHLRG